jgi:FkbM family methyltransferase
VSSSIGWRRPTVRSLRAIRNFVVASNCGEPFAGRCPRLSKGAQRPAQSTLDDALRIIAARALGASVDRVEIDDEGIWLVDRSGISWAYGTDAPAGTGFGLEDGHHRETREYELVRSLVPHRGVFVDVGANVGTFCIRLASERPDAGPILAVEPVSRTYALLRRNIARNGVRVDAVRAAVGEASGEIEVTTDAGTGNHIAIAGEVYGEKVPLRTLDELVAERGFARVDVIKCDVEGVELFALRGAQETIRRFRPQLVLEIEERWASRYGYSAREVFGFLAELGYAQFERVGGGDAAPEADWTPDDYLAAGGGNFFFPAPG